MSEKPYKLDLYVWNGLSERARLSGWVSAEDYQAILAQAAAAIERRIEEQANERD